MACLRILPPSWQSLIADEQVASAPILILGNKIDRPGAISEDELRMIFGLHGQTTGTVPGFDFLINARCFILIGAHLPGYRSEE